jgi:hypothetical protein
MQLPALAFAYNVTWHSSIGMAPLQVALGTDLKIPLSFPLRCVGLTMTRKRKALENVAQTKVVQDLTQGTTLKTQVAMEIQANTKRNEMDFMVGNSVYVTSG